MAEAYKEPKHHYTYADVLKWDERVRAEIIDGIIYVDGQMVEDDSGFYEEPVMLAAPTRMHQECHRELFLKIGNFLVGKTCKVYSAPFGVRLFPQKDESDNNLVEPDITVVCDSSKLDDR
ncbi:hypothetical protein FACS1894109_21280 [Spirochaetia bacterium]|nr:hypothetical protein FACS1894109_21280 [Spirochaetia bacterium]